MTTTGNRSAWTRLWFSTQHDEFIQPTDGKQEEADRKMLDKIRQDVITILMPRVIAEIHDPAIPGCLTNISLTT